MSQQDHVNILTGCLVDFNSTIKRETPIDENRIVLEITAIIDISGVSSCKCECTNTPNEEAIKKSIVLIIVENKMANADFRMISFKWMIFIVVFC